jgi:hypothetical protein
MAAVPSNKTAISAVCEPGFHARLSPSGAERWLYCTAAPAAEAQYPDSSTEFAAEGTAAHELSEYCLRGDYMPGHRYGDIIKVVEVDATYSFKVDKDMISHVTKYITYVRDVTKLFVDPVVLIEKRVYYKSISHDGSGTADAIIYGRLKETGKFVIWVIDLKYGKGVPVYPDDNPQAQLYALGAVETYYWDFPEEPDEIRVTIHQPRLDGEKTWTTNWADLQQFAVKAKAAVDIIDSGKGVFVPTDKGCQFCRHRKNCVARAKANTAALKLRFAEDDYND